MISPVSQISHHLRGELVRVGGTTGQELRLLRPRRRQRTGEGCPAERTPGDGLDPAHGLVAVDGSRLVVFGKRRLSAAVAAGSAAHAGIAPMHRAR